LRRLPREAPSRALIEGPYKVVTIMPASVSTSALDAISPAAKLWRCRA